MPLPDVLEDFDRRDWQSRVDGTVRFAMIALGWWTREKAIPALEDADLAEPTVVVSGSAEKATSVAAEWESIEAGITYEDFHDGVAADAYDAVYICTPNAYHLPYVETAAALGKDVLCEKPMEASVERAEELVAAAGDDVTLMIAYRLQTEPAARRARELIEAGAIGDPALVQGTMTQPLLELIPDPDQWRLDPDVAGYGTSVMDIGLYPLNTTRFLLGSDPERVSAMGYSQGEAFTDVPDERAAFTISFEDGVLGSFTASQNAHQDSHLRITGSDGQLVLDPIFFPWTDRGFSLEVNDQRADLEWEQVNQMTEEFEYFAHCLLEGVEPQSNGEHGLVDMRTLGAIYESMETERVVEV